MKLIEGVQLRVMHIFREGNQPTDFMANANQVEGRGTLIFGLDPFIVSYLDYVGYCRYIC